MIGDCAVWWLVYSHCDSLVETLQRIRRCKLHGYTKTEELESTEMDDAKSILKSLRSFFAKYSMRLRNLPVFNIDCSKACKKELRAIWHM